MIVDTHCHASTRWYEPVETLLFNMDRCGVEKAVLIPLLGSLDNMDMIAAVRAHPDRLIWFAAVDPSNTDAIKAARDAGARGLRMRANWRSAGDAPMALWAAAENLAISVVGTAASFTDGALLEVADHFPNLTLILEHLGGLARPDVGDRVAMTAPVCALASRPNIRIKLPGLGQLAERSLSIDGDGIPLKLDGVSDLLDQVINAFGADRMMWGSDFPPVASREGYEHALRWTMELLGHRTETERASIFGGTAVTLFN